MGKRVRFHVTPSDVVIQAVESIHQITGRARAAIIADMLDATAPVFQEQVALLRRIAESPETAAEHVRQLGIQGINTISQQLLDLPPPPKKRGRPRRGATS